MTDQALEIDGVSFGYTRAVKALDQVSFVVPSGGSRLSSARTAPARPRSWRW